MEEEGAAPEADFSGHTVLVVERELGHLLRLAPLLESWHVQVLGAADLEEALEVLNDEPECRTVLLDLDVSGPTACATIQAIRDCISQDGVVILMAEDCASARQTPGVAELVENCLALPADPAGLQEILEKYLGGKQTSQTE